MSATEYTPRLKTQYDSEIRARLKDELGLTLIIIEHDMDVALTVAEHVTMLHQGEKLLEGTPQEIRANKMVHDLYLGNTHDHG